MGIDCIGRCGYPLGHLAFRPDLGQADAEQYALYSAYIEAGLAGESHDRGSRTGLVVSDENSVFSNRFVQTSTLHQFRFLLGNAGHIKVAIPSLRRSALFELFFANLRDERLERRLHLFTRYELATELQTNVYVCGLCGEGRFVFVKRLQKRTKDYPVRRAVSKLNISLNPWRMC